MRRQEREMEQRKQAILSAARKLFLKKGFESVTMEDIAKKSEFTRVTLYNYFKSKFDILYEILNLALEDDFNIYLEKVKNVESAYDKLMIYARHHYEFFRREPGYHLLIVQYRTYAGVKVALSERNIIKMQENSKLSNDYLYQLIVKAIELGEFRPDLDPQLAVPFFLKSVFAIVHSYVFNSDLKLSDLDREIEYLLRAFI